MAKVRPVKDLALSSSPRAGETPRDGHAPAVIAAGLCALLLLALLWQTFSDNYPFDLAYFTTAGKMWRAGVDPYGPAFPAWGAPVIPRDAAILAYPPQWWAVATALSLLGDTGAAIAWKFAGLACLAGGAALLLRFARPGRLAAFCFLAVLIGADATRVILHLGQTSLVVFLGFALLLDGAARNGRAGMTAGLVLLMMKPQFGLFFLTVMASRREWRAPAAAAIAITAAACLPVLATFGIDGTIASLHGLLANLGRYAAIGWNRPGELSGLPWLAAVLGVPGPSPFLCLGAALLLALWASRNEGPAAAPRVLLVAVAILQATIPLHPYDLVLLPAFLLLIPTLRSWSVGLIVAANILLWRATSLAFWTYGYETSAAYGGVLKGSLAQAGAATLAAGLVALAMLCGRTAAPATAAPPSCS